MVILALYLAWLFAAVLFALLGCSYELAAILGLVGPVGLIWFCVRNSD